MLEKHPTGEYDDEPPLINRPSDHFNTHAMLKENVLYKSNSPSTRILFHQFSIWNGYALARVADDDLPICFF